MDRYGQQSPRHVGRLFGRSLARRSRAAANRAGDGIRDVKYSFGRLEAIKHEVTTLWSQGMVDADLIYQTAPDHENDRVVITVSRASSKLFKALAERYGTDAIAVQIDPSGP